MSDAKAPEETPENVAKLATMKADLPRLALLGIFGQTTAPKALVRDTSGEIETVAVGDRFARGTVQAIGEDQLVLSLSGGSTKVLRMPKG